MGQIDAFAEKHWDGGGWTDMYLRDEPPESIEKFRITVSELDMAISRHLSRYDEVLTGYGSYTEVAASVCAWGGPAVALFADANDSRIITRIFLQFRSCEAELIGQSVAALKAVPHSHDLLLANWNCSQVVLLADENALAKHLSAEDW